MAYSCSQSSQKKIPINKIIAQGDLQKIREARSEVMTTFDDIQSQLNELDEAISSLDSIKKLPLITTFTVRDTVFKHYLELQGNVATKQNIVLYPEIPGTLTRMHVKEGQRVRRGQLLATIDDGGLSQQVAQLEIQTELAKTTFERQQRLWEQKIGSEIQYLQAKTAYEAQQQSVAQLKSQQGKSAIRAPFSGIIDEVISEQGSVVAPGQSKIIRIVNLDNMYIEAEVPEKYIGTLKRGTPVMINFPILGTTLNSKIRQVGNFINPTSRSFKIEIAVPRTKAAIKPNLTSKIKINDYTNPKALLIPQSIISENALGKQYAYVVSKADAKSEAVAKKVIIQTGQYQGDLVEVIHGITNGDAIIQEGARSVNDGQRVKILNVQTSNWWVKWWAKQTPRTPRNNEK